jgi:hypothetical protein
MSSKCSSISCEATSSHCATGGENDDVETIGTHAIDETEPLIRKAGPRTHRDTGKQANGDAGNNIIVAGTIRALRKSSSDRTLRARMHQREPTADSARPTIHMSGSKKVH